MWVAVIVAFGAIAAAFIFAGLYSDEKAKVRLTYIDRYEYNLTQTADEIEKYLAGGCVACRKKMEKGASVVERFKSEKCGGKMKKTKKAQTGASIVQQNSEKGKLKKCGGKMKKVKKNYFGGILDKWL